MNDDFGLVNLGKKKKKRRLDNLKSIRSYSHIWLLMSKMNHLTHIHKHVSQREMFYCLTPRVKDQLESNRAIQEVVSIIQCPRECLGIFASSRGWIAGTLQWNVSRNSKKNNSPRKDTVGQIARTLALRYRFLVFSHRH